MARLRVQQLAAPSGVPDALRDRHDPIWADPKASAALMEACGLHAALSYLYGKSWAASPWWARFDAFRNAWIRDNGYLDPRWNSTPDYARLKAAGVDMSSSSRYRLRVEVPR